MHSLNSLKIPDSDIHLYIHSALRTIGLYTSTSIAIILYAIKVKEKENFRGIVTYSTSLLFLTIALGVNLILLYDLNIYFKDHPEEKLIASNLRFIPFLSVLGLLIIYIFTIKSFLDLHKK